MQAMPILGTSSVFQRLTTNGYFLKNLKVRTRDCSASYKELALVKAIAKAAKHRIRISEAMRLLSTEEKTEEVLLKFCFYRLLFLKVRFQKQFWAMAGLAISVEQWKIWLGKHLNATCVCFDLFMYETDFISSLPRYEMNI